MTQVAFFKPLESSFLGFDRLFGEVDRLLADAGKTALSNQSFPPFNLYKDPDGYSIEMALAGYKKSDVKIEHDRRNGILSISHTAIDREMYEQADKRQLLKQGIAKRSFIRTFNLADNVEVAGAEMMDGMLNVKLKVVVREEDKPLQIAVS